MVTTDLRADGLKLLRTLLEPCEGVDEHSWRKCRRCTAMHGLEYRFGVTMRALQAVVDDCTTHLTMGVCSRGTAGCSKEHK
jgi:hypothetical protein